MLIDDIRQHLRKQEEKTLFLLNKWIFRENKSKIWRERIIQSLDSSKEFWNFLLKKGIIKEQMQTFHALWRIRRTEKNYFECSISDIQSNILRTIHDGKGKILLHSSEFTDWKILSKIGIRLLMPGDIAKRKKPLRTRGFFCIEMLNSNNYKQRIHFWIQLVYIKRIKKFKKKTWKKRQFCLYNQQFYFLQAKQWLKKKSKRRSHSISNDDSDWLFSLLFADCSQIQRRAIHEQKSQSSQSKTLFKKESTIWIHNIDQKEQSHELNLIQWFVEMIVRMLMLISIWSLSQKI